MTKIAEARVVSTPAFRFKATVTASVPPPFTFNPPDCGGSIPPAIRRVRVNSSEAPLAIRFISTTARWVPALRLWFWKTIRTPELTITMITRATRISTRVNPRARISSPTARW